jgi:protein arginine kinase activator
MAVCEHCKSSADIIINQTTLCTVCAAKGNNRQFTDSLRFFDKLTLASKKNQFRMPSLPPDTSCNSCGLRFDEFSRIGKTGCADCYSAFEAAIGPALEQLHRSGPV